MDSFPDIRSFSDEQLTEFLASLHEEAARYATDPAVPYESNSSRLEDPRFAHGRKVLSNKIGIVRAELSARRGQVDPE